jgi:hypothetical protein
MGGEGFMKRVLMFVIVLLAISVMTSGIAYAPAEVTDVTGTFSMTATYPGEIKVAKSGIMLQRGALASGPIGGDDSRLSGQLQIVLNANFNTNTGEGVAFGSFIITNDAGTFEGRFTTKDSDYILFDGKIEGHGTGAYRGLLLKLDMTGIDTYRNGVEDIPESISATFTGYILSPHGAWLP